MSKKQRGRKHRSPQQRGPAGPRDPVPALRAGVPWSNTALRGNTDLTAAILGNAPPDQLVELLLPHL